MSRRAKKSPVNGALVKALVRVVLATDARLGHLHVRERDWRRREHLEEVHVSRIVRLASLAPDIIEAILAARANQSLMLDCVKFCVGGVERVDVQEDALEVRIRAEGLAKPRQRAAAAGRKDRRMTPSAETKLEGNTLVVRITMRFQRRGGRKRIVAPDGSAIVPTSNAAGRNTSEGPRASAPLAAGVGERQVWDPRRAGGRRADQPLLRLPRAAPHAARPDIVEQGWATEAIEVTSLSSTDSAG
jgi:hypothetical protein